MIARQPEYAVVSDEECQPHPVPDPSDVSSQVSVNQHPHPPSKREIVTPIPPDEDFEVREIKKKLKLIFCFYASFGDRMNIDYLRSSKFKRMMMDSGVSDRVPQKELDILFYGETHNQPNMPFENFLQTLTKLSVLRYGKSSISSVEAFHKLLYDHMLPLWNEIIQNPNQQTLYILQNDIQHDELL